MDGVPDSPQPVVLPTTVIGSYSVPEWLERAKTQRYQGRISQGYLDGMHEVATKAAIKDQERAGIDIVSGGELNRDNDIDYLLARLPGIEIPQRVKSNSYAYFDARVSTPLPRPGSVPEPLGLAEDFEFVRANTDLPVKFSFTGPLSLAVRVVNEAYADDAELVFAIARMLNAEARRLVDAGATFLQIDEPFLCGHRDRIETAIEGVNIVTEGIAATFALHICYGNRFARPVWEGHYDFLFPSIRAANVSQLVLEFARRGYDDLDLLSRFEWDRAVGLGVIDVKSKKVESPETIARRIRQAIATISPQQLYINPDCGLRHLPDDIARAKLTAMVQGAAMVRAELAASSTD